MRGELLGCVGEGGSLDSTDLALVGLLVLDDVGVHIGLLGCRGVLDICRGLDAFMVVALVAVLSDLSVGFGIEVFRLDCGDVADVARDVRLSNVTVLLSFFVVS